MKLLLNHSPHGLALMLNFKRTNVYNVHLRKGVSETANGWRTLGNSEPGNRDDFTKPDYFKLGSSVKLRSIKIKLCSIFHCLWKTCWISIFWSESIAEPWARMFATKKLKTEQPSLMEGAKFKEKWEILRPQKSLGLVFFSQKKWQSRHFHFLKKFMLRHFCLQKKSQPSNL